MNDFLSILQICVGGSLGVMFGLTAVIIPMIPFFYILNKVINYVLYSPPEPK